MPRITHHEYKTKINPATGKPTRVWTRCKVRVNYLTVFLCDRAYGGPEEGGWWYDTGEVQEVVRVRSKQQLKRERRRLEQAYSNEGRRDIGSVLSEGKFFIEAGKVPGQDYPQVRPHYE